MSGEPSPISVQVLWEPTPESAAASAVGRYARWLAANGTQELDTYEDLWRWSVSDLSSFWASIWDHFDVLCGARPTKALGQRTMPGAQWFPGATLNYAENMLRGPGSEVVVIARSQTRGRSTLTRGELLAQVGAVADGLRELGVRPGDRVAGYLPNIPEAVVAMLATVSLGAVWASCAPEFGTQAVIDRFEQISPTVLFAVDGYRYGVREVERHDAVAEIRAALPGLKATVAVSYLRQDEFLPGADTTWSALVTRTAEPRFEHVQFDHPLWILFSSGTTGLPKAITHSHGGITLELLKSHALQSDLGPRDRYFVYCTTSWVMWNLLVSSLLVGATAVLMDGNPGYPDSAELWRIVEAEDVTTYGCGASLLVASMKEGRRPGAEFDLSALRSIQSTGSVLPAEAFHWIYRDVKADLYLQSTSGGTDVSGAFVGGSPLLPVRAGRISAAALGVSAKAFDPDGNVVIGEPGELVIDAPMPSMPVYFWNDPDGRRYRESYFNTFPGVWRHGDWIQFDSDGSCEILGRSDGTLNRGGVRLGAAEIYRLLDHVAAVADSLIFHLEDSEGGLGRLMLFVQLTPGLELDDSLRAQIAYELRTKLSPRHVPDAIAAVADIPYNHTGKKLEVPMKRLFQGLPRAEVISDGAVRNPAAVDAFEALARNHVSPPAVNR